MVKRLFFSLLLGSFLKVAPLLAQPSYNHQLMQVEKMDRALVAVHTSKGNFLSWRWLPSDPEGYSFLLYRDGNLLGKLTGTNYVDAKAKVSSSYLLEVVDSQGRVIDTSEKVYPWSQPYKTIHFNRPGNDVALNAKVYSYYPSDIGVADADGDGKMEFLVKWQPTLTTTNMTGYSGKVIFGCYKMDGTELWRINLGNNVRTGEHLNQFLFYDMDGDGKAEFLCKTAPGSQDGKGNFVTCVADEPAIVNADNSASYVANNGVVNMGPEYLTVFDGQTGSAIHTVYYRPNREGGFGEPTILGNGFGNNYFGDTFGNRGDRLFAAVAYLNGKTPSAVFYRGCYAAICYWAVNFDGKKLRDYWYRQDDKPTDANGIFTSYGQGFHNLAIADVDGDGADEIIIGSAAIDHDGSLLYSTGLGHGDAVHVGDFDPYRPGLELYAVHEASPFGYTFHDARTGEIIHRKTADGDTGRGLIADIDATHAGAEMWDSSGKGKVYDVKGNAISDNKPSINYRVYWDGDLQDELLGDLSGHNSPYLEKWNPSTQKVERLKVMGKNLYEWGSSRSDHASKGTPAFQGDILGDWREELIFMNSNDSCSINIFTSTVPTDYRVHCLMTDHIYRMATIWQNVGYNQPPYLGYWLPDSAVEDKAPLTNGITLTREKGLGKLLPCYNILGQRVENDKGIIIRNGKKWARR